MLKQIVLVFFALLCVVESTRAQAWSGIIDPSRAVDWSSVGAIIQPRTTQCGSTIAAYTGTAAAINTAIAGCTDGQFVHLGTGTFALSTGITFAGKSNVTLRGDGPTNTILNFSAGDTCHGLGGDICVSDTTGYFAGSAAVQPGGSNAANWTAGYAKGATSITVDNVTGLAIGQVIILDQANDTTAGTGLAVCDVLDLCRLHTDSNSSNGRTINSVDYNQAQLVKITNIVGFVLTISPGLYMNNWRMGQTPKIWWIPQITGVGLENFTIDNTGSAGTVLSGIYFYDANNSWIKNVRSIKANRNHVWLYQSSHVTIRDSYFYATLNGATQSYGVEPFIASDNLVENNIFQQVTSPVVFASNAGNVIGYNFSIDNIYNNPPNWMQNTYANHDAGADMNLFEGNSFNAIDCDDVHGTGGLETYFRNRIIGWQTGKIQATHSIMLQSHCRGYNIIGNVLGTAAYHTNYEVVAGGSSTNCDVAIYNLGWSNVGCGTGTTPPDDAAVKTTLMRWGNYDTVNAAVRWDNTESSPGAVTFINAQSTPLTHTLPCSFYLSCAQKPSGSVDILKKG